jgi:selenocysteine-specific elongation factor
VFAAKGSGTVVTGTLSGGGLAVGGHVVVGPSAHPARIRGIQTLHQTAERIGPGHRVALNLVGIERGEVTRGDAVVEPGRWRPTLRCDASLTTLADLDHEVSRRGAYAAYLGSGEHPVRVRVLGASAIPPGQTGHVRLHLDQPVPLLPGDRYILREFGRSETVGGGEILDVAPVLPASKMRPDGWSGDVADRVIADRGWITADELEAVTGQRRSPTVGPWVTAPGAVEEMAHDLAVRVAQAGPLGLDVAGLDDREREVLARVPDLRVVDGRARPADAHDALADHPFLQALEAAGASPPPPDGVDRAELRELVRRGLVVERDGLYFAPSAVDAAAAAAATLLAGHPDGFTVAELRDTLGVTRKHALPLANELDARGVTRRRGDVRIAGPRLPATPR